MGIDLSAEAWQTSLEAAKANTLASSTAMAAHLNREMVRIYLQNFASWETMVDAGTIDNTNPPKPPARYDVAPDETGFSYPKRSDPPVAVCEMPAIPEDRSKPAVIASGLTDRVNMPRGDTHKVGDVVSGAELIALGANPAEIGDPQSTWRCERAGPFGVWRWYERI